MNKKSKEKFMQTKYAKKILGEQKMFRSISSQRFTIAKGVRLRVWQLPKFDDVPLHTPEIHENRSAKNKYLDSLKEEKSLALHERINQRV